MRHHEQTLAAFTGDQSARPEVLGVIVVGSVARGDERSDSDVDLYLVLTDDAYDAAAAIGQVAYVTGLGVSYPGGYLDVKLASPHYLRAAVDEGDDPTRASFDRGRVIFDRTGELGELVDRMADLSEQAWSQRVHTYRAQLDLYGGYFLVQAHQRGNRFLLLHSAVHSCLAAGRLALAQARRLYRGQKYLAADLAALTELPVGFLTAWWAVMNDPTPGSAHTLIQIVADWLGEPLSVDESLSTFITTNELSWLNRTIPPEYW